MAAPDYVPLPADMSLSVWNEALSAHVQSKIGRSQGHQFLYIKSGKDVAFFSSKVEAESLGFSKLSLRQIVELTHAKMLDCLNMHDVYQAENLMKSFIHRKLVKVHQSGLLFSVLLSTSKQEHKLAEVKVKQAQHLQKFQQIQQMQSTLEKSSNPLANIISPQMYVNLEKELNETFDMMRSSRGGTGVYYLTTPNARAHLLKLRSNPLPHILADRFLRQFGFTTCEYACLRRDTGLGQLIHSKVEQYVLPELQKALDEAQTDQAKRDCRDRLTQVHEQQKVLYITAMKYVKGVTFIEMDMEDVYMVFTSSLYLQALGEMIFLDHLIGNADRLGSVTCNLGNFLLNENAEKPIILIDHDYTLNEMNFGTVENDIKQLLHPKLHANTVKILANTFIAKMKEGREQNFFEDLSKNKKELKFILKSLSEGISRAAKNFVKQFSQEPHLIYEILDVPLAMKEHFNVADPALLFKMLDLVKKYV